MQTKSSNSIQAFWVALGSFSAFLVSILSAAILSRYLNKHEYGTYRQILFLYNTLLVIFTAGLPRVFEYFLPRYSIDQGKDIVFKVTKLLFLCGILFSATLFFFSDIFARLLNNRDLALGLKCFSPIPMFLLPTLGIEGIFTSYKKTHYIAGFNVITRTLMLLGIVLPVIFFESNYLSAIIGWGVASVLIFWIGWKFKNLAFRQVESRQESGLKTKEILAYSIPLVVASLAGIAIKSADQYYISHFFGSEIFAEFANGFMELPFVTMITGATSAVIMPLFSKMFHLNEDKSELIQVWQRALFKSSILIYPLVIFFIAYAKEIMTLLYTDNYSNSAIYFQINLVLNFFNIVIFAPLFFSMGKTALYAKVHIVLAVYVWLVDYLLIQTFNNPIAIAINSTVLHIVKTLYFLYVSSKLLKVSFKALFPYINLLKLIFHNSLIVLIILLIDKGAGIEDFLFLRLILFAILYAFLILVTAPLFRLDYAIAIRPFINVIRSKMQKT